MANTEQFVIVGGGLAGAKAAESLRGWGFDGRVILIGDEPVRPYERPPLSKSYLRGKSAFEDAAVHPVDYYAERNIELLSATEVIGIDTAAKEVSLRPGGKLGWDRLLLATGARPRRLDVAGSDLAGVFYLRTVADADAIRTAAASAARAVVVGAGWLGAEVAASLRRLGLEVAMVDPASVPLESALGPEVGSVFADLHAGHGVDLHLGTKVESLAGDGRIEGVGLADGTSLAADLVVVGIGVLPRTELAETAGIEVDSGIVVDCHLETSVPGVFAAGDVANAYHPLLRSRVRVEHWFSALTQSPTAAANMLGHKAVADWVPWVSSKQYDFYIEYTGHAVDWNRVVVRGDMASRVFVAFWLDEEERVLAGLSANVAGMARHIKALVASGRPVEPARLADPDLDLGQLAAEALAAADVSASAGT